MRDFSLQMYQKLCEAITKNSQSITVSDYIKHNSDSVTILRHDIDLLPENALKIAKVEYELGISSTYYFRTIPNVFNIEIMSQIHDLGHEIGYHYEVLDLANGDYQRALEIFKYELKKFPFKIETICMHGNPTTAWINKDLWKRYDFKELSILGEAYLTIDYSNLFYFSDTGRTWKETYSVKDFVSGKKPNYPVDTTRSLIEHIRSQEGSYCIVTHPQRWTNQIFPWVKELFLQNFKNIGKLLLKQRRLINCQ